MNAKMIEGLKAIRDGINLILEGCEESLPTANPTKGVEAPKTVAKQEETVSEVTEVTREQLEGMTYNNIKKLAKEMGIPAVGSREEIVSKILGEENSESDEAVPETKPAEKKGKKTSEAPKEVPVDDKDNDPIYAKVKEAVSDLENEDIADILADVGISAKGKRESLIDKVVKAVKDGLLDFDDDEEESEEVADEAPAKKTNSKESEESEDDEEEDLTNDIENPNMTKARKEAIIAQDEEIREQWENDDISREDLVEFLQEFYDTDDDMSDMSDEDILDTYIDAVCRLVDDDGDLVEEGAYTLNGEPACCGRVLAYSEDTNVFICEHCGEEYEAEE